jgi:hypothetical protein
VFVFIYIVFTGGTTAIDAGAFSLAARSKYYLPARSSVKQRAATAVELSPLVNFPRHNQARWCLAICASWHCTVDMERTQWVAKFVFMRLVSNS